MTLNLIKEQLDRFEEIYGRKINNGEYAEILSALYQAGRSDLLDQLLLAAMINGLDDSVTYHLGLLTNNSVAEAIQFFEKAIKESGSFIYSALAHLYKSNGDFENAIRTLETAIKNDRIDWEVYHNLGLYYSENNDLSNAVRVLEEARKKNILMPEGFCNLGICYFNLGNSVKALEVWEGALNEEKTNPGIFDFLIDVYLKEKNLKKAETILDYAKRRRQTHPDIFLNLGCFYYENGNIQKALKVTKEALDLGHKTEDLFHNFKIFSSKIADSNKHNSRFELFQDGIVHYISGDFTIISGIKEFPNLIDDVKEAIHSNEVVSGTYYIIYALTHDDSYLEGIIESLQDRGNHDYKAYALLAEVAHEHGSLFGKTRQEYLREMVQQIRNNDEFEIQFYFLKKATSNIKIIKSDPYLSKTVIAKENVKPFDREIEIRHRLESIVGEEIITPTFVDSFKYSGLHYYVMVLEEGNSLTDLIHQNRVPDMAYDKILRTIAKIHVKFPLDILDEYPLQEKLDNAFLKLEIDESYKKHAKPILDVVLNSKNKCYNNDSTTDNWLINSKSEVILIDTEYRGIIPYALDLAHLLNLVPYWPLEQRMQKVEKYIKSVNEIAEENNMPDRRIEDKGRFIFEYCNCVIVRSITYSSYLLSKARPDDIKKIKEAGIEIIDHMFNKQMIDQKFEENYRSIQTMLIDSLNSKR